MIPLTLNAMASRFDTSFLDIRHVKVDAQSATVRPLSRYVGHACDHDSLQHSLGERHAVMGSSLSIPLPKALLKGQRVAVSVEYSTTAESTALQWLDKA